MNVKSCSFSASWHAPGYAHLNSEYITETIPRSYQTTKYSQCSHLRPPSERHVGLALLSWTGTHKPAEIDPLVVPDILSPHYTRSYSAITQFSRPQYRFKPGTLFPIPAQYRRLPFIVCNPIMQTAERGEVEEEREIAVFTHR